MKEELILKHGRPCDGRDRIKEEMAVYDLLDELLHKFLPAVHHEYTVVRL